MIIPLKSYIVKEVHKSLFSTVKTISNFHEIKYIFLCVEPLKHIIRIKKAGDFSSFSRLVKACFLKQNSHSEKTEAASVSQFFHILDAVAMVEGAVITHEETNDITLYASCINTDKGIYYYKTYYNNQIVAVDMYSENLDSDELITFNWIEEQVITYMNKKEKDAENE